MRDLLSTLAAALLGRPAQSSALGQAGALPSRLPYPSRAFRGLSRPRGDDGSLTSCSTQLFALTRAWAPPTIPIVGANLLGGGACRRQREASHLGRLVGNPPDATG